MFKIEYFFFLLLSSGTIVSMAQTKDVNEGNEAANMFNDATARDKNALVEAENDWWKQVASTREQRIKRWKEATFGMFVHWGVYSQYGNIWKGKQGGGYAEHLMRVMKIPRQEYLDSARRFNPVRFDAEEWVLLAKDAGMKYFIITAKHHDGFAMYPTAFSSEYSLANTLFQRDPLAELAAACRKHGLLFGFYYSHAFDWEHPDAPGNDWDYDNPGGDKLLGGAKWFDKHPDWLTKAKRYVDEKAIPQIEELIQRYHPDLLWFDTPHKLPLSENLRILKAIRMKDPSIVVNGRLARTEEKNYGDYLNTADRPEEYYPVSNGAYWEAIPTTNESYGYSSTDKSHKSTAHFIKLLAKATAMGGNILMNIGPKGDGSIDGHDVAILKGLGQWMKGNRESVIAVAPSGLPRQPWGVITQRGNILYLHVFDGPQQGELIVGGLKGRVKSVSSLSGKTIENYSVKDDGLHISTDRIDREEGDSVVVVELESNSMNPNDNDVICLDHNFSKNRLLSFYAKQIGPQMKFGDGKKDRYYVTGWTGLYQGLVWNTYVLTGGRFKVSVRYVKDVANTGGSLSLTLGGKDLDFVINPASPIGSRGIQLELGSVNLSKGNQKIELKANSIEGAEMVKFLEVILDPE
ncbi:alpha-L-fucosidase [Sphingobacterium sp. UBA5670]|uniref:alpha-L-fucosidase n=1 Tax=Sphingobacterium sp. UBA5670 TaxID=1947502 RepID=UPI0025F7BD84|nr:alpha-L-fucosidase [Sphingobacterium sp. UBA5670]